MTFLGLRERPSAGRGPSEGLAIFKRADRQTRQRAAAGIKPNIANPPPDLPVRIPATSGTRLHRRGDQAHCGGRGGTFFFSVLAGMGRLQVPHPRWRMLMCLLHAGLFHH